MDEGTAEKRVRRTTRYSGDFQFLFEGSSDEDREIAEKAKKMPNGKTKRTKECPGCGAVVAVSTRECRFCDYQFTSKSLLVNQQSAVQESQTIRERFPFEPERDDDGSLFIQVILGRRPRKTGKRWARSSGNVSYADMTAMESRYEYEYLIKFKTLSYLHVKWLSASDIESMSQKSKASLYRYLTKLDKGDSATVDDPEIDPSFVEVESILDYREEEVVEVVEDASNQAALRELEKVKVETAKVESSGDASSKSNVDSDDEAVEVKDESAVVTTGDDNAPKTQLQVFQPGERCRRVLERIWEDFYSASFQDPVDTTVYDDYLDVIDEPMCLSDVKRKLENGDYSRYNQYKQFANDMRKIWRNCKQYNDYHSSIWLSANYLSMYFERLYQAWIIAFSDGSISLSSPLGRPWEATCRSCQKDANDDEIILCDHCDAPYHIYCLKPPMASVPEDAWMCRRCLKWLAKSGAKVLSATAEEEAKKMLEGATSRKTVRVKRKKYLVKWRGLSYRECTWETKEDIKDDEMIAEYHRINDAPPDEPPLTQAEIGVELAKDRKSQIYPAGYQGAYPNPVVDLDAQIYAQIRSYHFLKWNKTIPEALMKESGPPSYSYTYLRKIPQKLPPLVAAAVNMVQQDSRNQAVSNFMDSDEDDEGKSPSAPVTAVTLDEAQLQAKDAQLLEKARDLGLKNEMFQSVDPYKEVVSSLLGDMVYATARDHEKAPIAAYPSRPPLPSRYQVPSEIEICAMKGDNGLCMRVGNFNNNVVVLGFRPDKKNQAGPVERFHKIKPGDFLVAIDGLYVHQLKFDKILKLLETNQPFVYLRFLRVPRCIESKSPDIVELCMNKKPAQKPSQHLWPRRSKYFGVFPADDGSDAWETYFYRDRMQVYVGRYMKEKDAAVAYDDAILREDNFEGNLNFTEEGELTENARVLASIVDAERLHNQKVLADSSRPESERDPAALVTALDERMIEKELDGFHSEDSLDSESEDSMSEGTASVAPEDDELPGDHEIDDDDEGSANDEDDDEDDEDEDDEDSKPGRKKVGWNNKSNDAAWAPKVSFDEEGPIGRLLRAVNECAFPPIRNDWTKYVLELGLQNNAMKDTVSAKGRVIEQIDLASNQVLRTWKSMLAAAKALSIPVADIYNTLREDRDSAGGYKWRYGDEIPVEIDPDNPEDAAEERKDDSWQLKLPSKSKEYKGGNKLRDYQVEGLNWLLRCWYLKRSSILADEMGLGKTAQVVSFLDHLFEVESIKGPFLICVPLSTIGHWKREVESWSNMRACVYHDAGGGRDMRDIIREYEWYFKGRSRRLLKFHVLITTYDDLVRDYEELAEVPWRAVIVDEAHRLKNINSKLLDCTRTVSLKGQNAYGYQHRVLMTGTPLQNNTLELWSLLNFIEPAKFPDLEKFQARFGTIKTQEQVEHLQKRIAPHLLRRVKEDVATDIPPKEETIIDVELTTMQKQYYRAIFEHNHAFLMQNTKGNNTLRLMNIQMELRKCCNHPFLINGVEIKEMDNLEGKLEEEAASARTSSAARSKLLFDQKEYERRRMDDIMIPASGKMVLLDKLLPKLKREGHKVLIFSQMVKMIDLIEEYCEHRAYNCFRLDGRISGNDRQKSIDKFNKDPSSFVFLLSTRAGGVGINLTAADIVIIFDSDWNPQNDIQAMARCHRIGQSKQVKIYRLITRRSFEQEMFDRASKKLGLEQAVLGTRNFQELEVDEANKSQAKMDAKEMEQLLREGAYAVLLEDDSETIKEFYEQDIDQILEHRAHVLITEGNQQTESWLNKKKLLSKTNKRLFTGDSAKEFAEIDVNDPDFWKKVLPDLVTPDTMFERLSDGSLMDEDDNGNGNVNTRAIEKFMKDLSLMMDGMLDLSRRNQLPEHERAVCLKLLLRITLSDEIFDEDDRLQAQDWLSVMEGARNRRVRQDLYQVEDNRRVSGPRGGRGGRGGGGRGGRGGSATKAAAASTGGRRPRGSYGWDDNALDEDDEDEDEDEEQEDNSDDEGPRKRGRKRGSTNSNGSSKKSKRRQGSEDGDDDDDDEDFNGKSPAKPRRKRRTKAEMEADRLAELERKAEKARLQALGTEEKKPRKRRTKKEIEEDRRRARGEDGDEEDHDEDRHASDEDFGRHDEGGEDSALAVDEDDEGVLVSSRGKRGTRGSAKKASASAAKTGSAVKRGRPSTKKGQGESVKKKLRFSLGADEGWDEHDEENGDQEEEDIAVEDEEQDEEEEEKPQRKRARKNSASDANAESNGHAKGGGRKRFPPTPHARVTKGKRGKVEKADDDADYDEVDDAFVLHNVQSPPQKQKRSVSSLKEDGNEESERLSHMDDEDDEEAAYL